MLLFANVSFSTTLINHSGQSLCQTLRIWLFYPLFYAPWAYILVHVDPYTLTDPSVPTYTAVPHPPTRARASARHRPLPGPADLVATLSHRGLARPSGSMSCVMLPPRTSCKRWAAAGRPAYHARTRAGGASRSAASTRAHVPMEPRSRRGESCRWRGASRSRGFYLHNGLRCTASRDSQGQRQILVSGRLGAATSPVSGDLRCQRRGGPQRRQGGPRGRPRTG